MGFFDAFSLLLAAAFLILACQRERIRELARNQKSLTFLSQHSFCFIRCLRSS